MFEGFNPRAPCGARQCHNNYDTVARAVSIHAPRAGRDPKPADHLDAQEVSIHAPRAGRDSFTPETDSIARMFQSTRPVRGATTIWGIAEQYIVFQSTRPVRGATLTVSNKWHPVQFQSTRPVRGATRAV